jgi:hypothetical protein
MKDQIEYRIDGEDCTYDDLIETAVETEGHYGRAMFENVYTMTEIIDNLRGAGHKVEDLT